MGIFLTRIQAYYVADDDDEEEDDDMYTFMPSPKQTEQDCSDMAETSTSPRMTTDAAVNAFSQFHTSNEISDSVVNLEKVTEIEEELDLYEKISLIFLLYDDPDVALQYMLHLEKGAPLKVLTEWASSSNGRWNVKLLEALCIIQNYNILCEKLGYDEEVLKGRFLPHNKHTSLFIDQTKKALYSIAESFDSSITDAFLRIIKDDFKTKNLVFYEYDQVYLEMYFLHWITIRYIYPPHDLSNLCRAMKVMERYDLVEFLQDIMDKSRERSSSLRILEAPSRQSSVSPCLEVDLIRKNSFTSSDCSNRVRKHSHDKEYCYRIDSDCPGVCLIINQKYFYTELDKQYQHLKPVLNHKLEDRLGTDIDRDRLKETFEKFGFIVTVKENIVHYEIIPTINDAVLEVPEQSSFILCILSHGTEGKIFGVNSIPVKVKEIQDAICKNNSRLKGQPKVLILQSCQGQECQEITVEDESNHEDDLQTDGLQITNVPRTADMLVFWATVPGYGAVRDKKRGSWFIQSFCDKILENSDRMHFQEICTMVKQDVIRRRWETKNTIRVMVPIEESTFSKFLYLPSIKNDN